MNRYFVVVFGIWLFCVSLYLIFSKIRFLAVIPALLTLFTIIISIGPWSVFSLPETRQFSRLKANLIQAHILQESNSIVPLKDYDAIDAQLSGKIYDGISYICSFHDCKKIEALFPRQYEHVLEDYQKQISEYRIVGTYEDSSPSTWEIVDGIATQIKVQRYYSQEANTEQPYLYFYSGENQDIFPLDISGYDMIYDMKEERMSDETDKNIILDLEKKTLTFIGSDGSEVFDISSFIDALTSRYEATRKEDIPSDLFFTQNGTHYDIRVYFQSLIVENPLYKSPTNGEDSLWNEMTGK